MSMFEDPHYRWRETYFVLFDSRKQPRLKRVEEALTGLSEHYRLSNPRADASGRFESLTLISPHDFAALDICYTSGEEVIEQAALLAKEMKDTARETGRLDSLERLRQCDGRFDVLHFEHVPEYEDEEEEDDLDEMLDPSALLLVLGVLAKISGGVAVDPQAGTFLNEDD